VQMFDAGKTRMIRLPYGKKNCDNMLSRFSSDTGALRTDGQTDGQTDRRTDMLYEYHASVC